MKPDADRNSPASGFMPAPSLSAVSKNTSKLSRIRLYARSVSFGGL
ncbi:MAG: hypothetical protein LBD35_01015 [Prevotellaceae bacterium]|nr:hypothetical protein [Prevotellaceae bacterium]